MSRTDRPGRDARIVELAAHEVFSELFINGFRDNRFQTIFLIRTFKPGCKIYGISDRCKIFARFRADRAEYDGSGIDSDTDGNSGRTFFQRELFFAIHRFANVLPEASLFFFKHVGNRFKRAV